MGEDEEIAGEDDSSRSLAYTDELPPEVVAQDFMSRDTQSGRRAFLMNYCKEQNHRNFKIEQALNRGKFIQDETLINIEAKIKTPNPAAALNVLQMQSSAANLQE